MNTKKFFIAVVALTLWMSSAQAQNQADINKNYAGAEATQKLYRAVYQLDQAPSDIIKKAIRNINNLLEDPRLKGKIQVEIVTFSGGVEAVRKGSEYEEGFKKLVDKGVLVVECLNTIREKKIDKSELYDFIGYAPSGNGELVIRAADGWVIVKP